MAQLDHESVRAVTLLSAFAGTDFSVSDASAVLVVDSHNASRLLDRLVKAALLWRHGPDLHRIPSPIQVLAQERLSSLDDGEARGAAERALATIATRGLVDRTDLTRDTWTSDDRLDYADYARSVAAFIHHRETRGPLGIAILGSWGAGKTSFMRMIQERLDPYVPGTRTPTRLRLEHAGAGPASPPRNTRQPSWLHGHGERR